MVKMEPKNEMPNKREKRARIQERNENKNNPPLMAQRNGYSLAGTLKTMEIRFQEDSPFHCVSLIWSFNFLCVVYVQLSLRSMFICIQKRELLLLKEVSIKVINIRHPNDFVKRARCAPTILSAHFLFPYSIFQFYLAFATTYHIKKTICGFIFHLEAIREIISQIICFQQRLKINR